MYHEVSHSKPLHCAHTVYVCVPDDAYSQRRFVSLYSAIRFLLVRETKCADCAALGSRRPFDEVPQTLNYHKFGIIKAFRKMT
jgi:hypothetical protein